MRTTIGLVSRNGAVPFVSQCEGRTANSLGSRRLHALFRELACLEGLRSGGGRMLGDVRSRNGLARRLGGRVLSTRALIMMRSLCEPCHPGHHAHTAVTGRGKLRPLTSVVLLRVASGPMRRRTETCISRRGNIGGITRTLGKTGSVVTRHVSSRTSCHVCVHGLAAGGKDVSSATGGTRARSMCRVCCRFRRPIEGLTKRHVLTLGHNRGRGFVAIGMGTPRRSVLHCLGGEIVGGSGPGAAPVLGTIMRSDCGHLVKPTVRQRVHDSLASGTRSNTVRMFNGGLRRLLVRPPVTNGIMLK